MIVAIRLESTQLLYLYHTTPHMLALYAAVHAQTHTLPSVMWLYELILMLIIWLAKNSLSIISLLRYFLTMWEKLHFRRSDSFHILVGPLSEENTSLLNCCISWVNCSRKKRMKLLRPVRETSSEPEKIRAEKRQKNPQERWNIRACFPDAAAQMPASPPGLNGEEAM